MILAFTAVSAIVPTLLLVWYFHSRDVFREPSKVVWATFGLGVASVVPILLLDLLIYLVLGDSFSSPYAKGLSSAFLMAAIPEELFKFLVVMLYAARHKAFDEPMDGIVYGVVASLGFATLENVLYILDGGLGVALIRSITAVPCHAFLGAIMGYFIGQAKFGPAKLRKRTLFHALFWPVLLHGLYDFPLLTMIETSEMAGPEGMVDGSEMLLLSASTVAVLIIEWVWAIKLTRRLRAEQLLLRDQQQPSPEQQAPPDAQAAQLKSAQGPKRRTVLGWLVMSLGGILCSAGGLVILGVTLNMFLGEESGDETGAIILGTIIIGVLPAALGLVLFVWGKRRVVPLTPRPH